MLKPLMDQSKNPAANIDVVGFKGLGLNKNVRLGVICYISHCIATLSNKILLVLKHLFPSQSQVLEHSCTSGSAEIDNSSPTSNATSFGRAESSLSSEHLFRDNSNGCANVKGKFKVSFIKIKVKLFVAVCKHKE